MIIEIRRAGFVNKGAELMLHAIVQKVKERYPDAILTMAPTSENGSQPFSKMVKLDFYPKAWLWRYGMQWGDLAGVIPKKLRRRYGLILDKEVDVVLDAAGFAYSDQWGEGNSIELKRASKRWKNNSTKVILMPQAFGPFGSDSLKKCTAAWIDNVNLIFAREQDSYLYLKELSDGNDKVKMYPDFTNLVTGVLPENYDPTDKRIALVPNYRMIDKTGAEESKAYLPFMIRCAQYLVAKGYRPFVLVHEGDKDMWLANEISNAAGGIPIVAETNPIYIKGILGSCDATIGSRFHGLVSALSQGVPSLSTGWSHKYARLFEDYGFDKNEGVISVLTNDKALHDKIDLIIVDETAQPIRDSLNKRSEELKKVSEKLWELVFKEIETG